MLGYALIAGLLPRDKPDAAASTIEVFQVAPPPPRAEPSTATPLAERRRQAAPSPRAERATPVEIVAPPPIILPEVPPPVSAADLAAAGSDASAGASTLPGAGNGSGGEGEFEGGEGGGTPARWVRGRIRYSDYSRAAYAAGIEGRLSTRYVVGTDGRVETCAVTRSSGSADLDETTCRLIAQRFRFRPRRDADGRALPDVVTNEHFWSIE